MWGLIFLMRRLRSRLGVSWLVGQFHFFFFFFGIRVSGEHLDRKKKERNPRNKPIGTGTDARRTYTYVAS